MANEELLTIVPMTLKFPFELNEPISSYFHLKNHTDNYVAFKVKMNNPANYSVSPNSGVVLPRSISKVDVIMLAQDETPSDMHSNDRFLIQSVIASPGVTAKEVTHEMFSEGNQVKQTIVKITYTFKSCTCL